MAPSCQSYTQEMCIRDRAMAVQLGQRDALRYEEEMAAVRRDYDTAMGEVDPCKK